MINDIESFDNKFAKLSYEAYSKGVGGVAYNGDPLPTWEEILADPSKEKIVLGWKSVAKIIRIKMSSTLSGILELLNQKIHKDILMVEALVMNYRKEVFDEKNNSNSI